MDGRPPGDRSIDPAELLRGALEKIVFFECRVSQLESELAAALKTAERATADASAAYRRAVELEGALAAARGEREESDRRGAALTDRVHLLERERERLLAGLVEQARVAGAPSAEGDAAGEQADLAGFIAELRGELEELRRFKASVGEPGRPLPPTLSTAGAGEREVAGRPPAGAGSHPSVGAIAGRLAGEGRVGLSAADAGALRSQLTTASDRLLFEEAIERLRSGEPQARLRAVKRLEALGPRAAAPLLAAAIGREPDADVKVAMLAALAAVEEPFAAEIAGGALEDGRAPVRAAALDALARLAPDRAEPRVLGALGDASPIVRRRAALLLGFSRSAQADEALAAALRDADSGVARAAAAALSGRPSAAAQQALTRALEHADARVRRAAAETLGRWSGERVSGDAPDHERRRAARRIAERLAAMAPAEVRTAVVDAAERTGPAGIVVHRFSGSRTGRQTVASSVRTPVAPRARVTVLETARAHPLAPTRSSAAAPERAVAAPPPAGAAEAAGQGTALSESILAELRTALRGRAAEELAQLLSAPAAQVASVLQDLASRGEVVARGPRWYVG